MAQFSISINLRKAVKGALVAPTAEAVANPMKVTLARAVHVATAKTCKIKLF